MPRFTVFVPSGEFLPRGYGIAWRDPSRDGTITMPVPFNVIGAGLRWLWIKLVRVRFEPTALDIARREGYAAGRTAARHREYERGYVAGYQARQDELSAKLAEIRDDIRDARAELGE